MVTPSLKLPLASCTLPFNRARDAVALCLKLPLASCTAINKG